MSILLSEITYPNWMPSVGCQIVYKYTDKEPDILKYTSGPIKLIGYRAWIPGIPLERMDYDKVKTGMSLLRFNKVAQSNAYNVIQVIAVDHDSKGNFKSFHTDKWGVHDKSELLKDRGYWFMPMVTAGGPILKGIQPKTKVVCKDCNDTKIYVGLWETGPCLTCSKK